MLLAVTFDPTITLGTILQVIAFVAVAVASYYAIKGQLQSMQQTLQVHADQFNKSDIRVDRIEVAVGKMGEHLQRLIGREEAKEYYSGDRRNRPPVGG